MKNYFSIISLCTVLLFSACSTTQKEEDGTKLILTTTQIIADGVKNIVGEDSPIEVVSLEVVSLMGSGVDPHLYKAAQSDMVKMNDADIIIKNGLHLEGKLAEVLHKYGKLKPVYSVADGMDASLFRKIGNNALDPHLWFNVNMWKNGIASLLPKIQALDPENKEKYTQNWKTYATKLDSLDQVIQSKIDEIPESQRVMITAHDAFGYFAIRYGLEVRSLQGLSTLDNPGLKDIEELVNFITERKIKAVFVESSVPKKNIEVLVRACQDLGHDLKIGGTLYSDALGEEGTSEGTYVGAVTANTNLIVNALK